METMAAHPEGTPCWADAMFPDVEAAKAFYGELLGWTFDEGSPEFGGYTQAFSDGKAVAAVVPRMPGTGGPPAWNLYFATSDVASAAERIRDNGGALLMDPMPVGSFGTMVTAEEPSGVFFSLWQPDAHTGFGKTGEPGAYCWAEVTTRDVERADHFFGSLFPYEAKRMQQDSLDFTVWHLGGEPVAGRLRMTDDFPPDLHPYVNVYFGVEDCDAAIDTVTRLGGTLQRGPLDSAYGRYASVRDPQGAAFSVIDVTTTAGEMPAFT
ncbi:hydroxylase [Streptomyces pristinaespiralis ATCC 25486]|uniref:Hydroxylase n=2 Tax=Streptomyces pristinaespiralis TaxID=38300 RepID=D6X7R9_STRE2|nr:hydroxylase [Streptomyces pristinaespiralis ATCC 25486]